VRACNDRVLNPHAARPPYTAVARGMVDGAAVLRFDEEICVVFATVRDSLKVATVRHVFSVPLSQIYYSTRGCLMLGVSMNVTTLKSPVVKRSIVVAGHKTSVSLEDAFWKGLKEIAGGRHITLSDLVATIDSERRHGNLSSAIRLFVLDFYRRQIADLKEARLDTQQVVAPATVPAYS
jgi:predicted DNA-binding ribbon-helix-helix protein